MIYERGLLYTGIYPYKIIGGVSKSMLVNSVNREIENK